MSDDKAGGAEESGGDDRLASLLAAAHAALNPQRRAMRCDIIGESILRALERTGPAPLARVRAEVAKLWNTPIPEVLVRQGLQDALAAGLVVKQAPMFGEDDWVLSSQGHRDVVQDGQWANRVIRDFDSEASERFSEDPDSVLLKPDRFGRMAEYVRMALAVGAEGLYDVMPLTSPNCFRSLRYNLDSAREALSSVQPASARSACERLLIEALNPHDPFGDEYLTLLAAANVVHGLVTRRDLATQPQLAGGRIAIDTSALVVLAGPPDEARGNLLEMIELSKNLGVDVVVTEHTVQEWRQLFAAAEEELGSAEKIADPQPLTPFASLLNNPFLYGFESQLPADEHLTWHGFRARWADPRDELVRLGIKVRVHGNGTPDDRQTAERMVAELRRLNRSRGEDDGPRKRLRRPEAIAADAESAAMIARWRSKGSPDRAFLIAKDRQICDAYRAACPNDKITLAVTPQAWLLLTASLVIDDPSRQSAVAKTIGNAALRDSFLSVAGCFTYEEVQQFAGVLADGESATSAMDITDFIQGTLDGFEEEVSRADRMADVRLRGVKVLHSRVSRRNQRARRSEERVASEVSRAVEIERAAAENIREKAERDSKREIDALRLDAQTERENRLLLLRAVQSGIFLVLVVAIAAALWFAGWLDHGTRKPVALVTVLLLAYPCYSHVRGGKRASLQVAGAVILLGVLINLFTDMVRDM